MQHETHHTLIAILAHHVESWRKANEWSRESVIETIVETHYRLGFNKLTGIEFEPNSRDTFNRMRANATKVYRWLDDSSKDNNLLPANFIPSILAALPPERRAHCLDDLLAPVGMASRFSDPQADAEEQAQAVHHFAALTSDAASTQVAVAALLDGIDPGEPEHAHKRLARLAATIGRARVFVGALIHRRRKQSSKQS